MEGEISLPETGNRITMTDMEWSPYVREFIPMGVPDECLTACCESAGTIVKLCL